MQLEAQCRGKIIFETLSLTQIMLVAQAQVRPLHFSKSYN